MLLLSVLASIIITSPLPTLGVIPRLECGQDAPAPLLNYQDLQDLKQHIAQRLVEVEVTLAVPAGGDPSVAPVLVGQAVCVAAPASLHGLIPHTPGSQFAAASDSATDSVPDSATDSATDSVPDSALDSASDSAQDPVPDSASDSATDSATDSASDSAQDPVPDSATDSATDSASDSATDSATDSAPALEPGCTIVASRFLLDNAASVRVRCAAHPEWIRASGRQGASSIPLAVVTTDEPHGCAATKLAPLRFQSPGTFVFSVDDPVSQFPNVFYGELGDWAEAPLAGYLLARMGLPLSGPLFSADGRLVAINLRRYVPASPVNLAATAAQVRSFLSPARRAPADNTPAARRLPFPQRPEPPADGSAPDEVVVP